MPRYRVTTIIHEYHFVDAESPEAACELACQAEEPDTIDVTDRYAQLENGDG